MTLLLLLVTLVLGGTLGDAGATTIYVANNGIDPPGCAPPTCIVGSCVCGAKAAPCRSITCGIMTAAAGDTVLVGPGVYGDLDHDGTPGDSAGEESPGLNSPGCGCLLALNKAVKLLSTNGAAETLIDGTTVASNTTVLIISNGGAFGAPGKGFFITQSNGNKKGMVIDADNVAIRGNQLVPILPTSVGIGMQTVDSPGSVVIEGNQVVGWATAIYVQGPNKILRNNVVAFNGSGIVPAETALVTGNVAVGNNLGIVLETGAQTITGNAAVGNVYGFGNHGIGPPGGGAAFTGTFEKNDTFGNICGLTNDGVIGLVADKNYWGASSGPGADPADPVCESSGGTTTTVPFAKSLIKVRPALKP